jgi:two-component system, LytTR family, sensor histidine kinase AgrC
VYSKTYMAEKQRGEAYAKAIETNARQQLYYVENLEHLIGRLKSERHDFNNHLSVINGLLESGETDKAKDYAAQLVKDAAEYQNIVNVPYQAVRALLNHKLSAARDSGIELRLDVGLPEGLKLNEFDLTAILGNLLDNAAEACAGLTNAAPYISITIKFQPDYLVIRVANPFEPMQEGRGRSAKPNPENHGFGLKNVEFLTNKHNGLMNIKKEGGVFSVDIALLVE